MLRRPAPAAPPVAAPGRRDASRALLLGALSLVSLFAVAACEQGRSNTPANVPSRPTSGRGERAGADAAPPSTSSASSEPSAPPPRASAPISEEASDEPGGDDLRRTLPALRACAGGFDIPAFDASAVPWWNALTGEARDAMLSSATGRAWDERSQGPIVAYQTAEGIELRSVDGCWTQLVTSQRGQTWVIDGPSATAWGHPGEEVWVLDLLGTADPLLLLERSTYGFPVLMKDPAGPSVAPARAWFFGPQLPSERRRTLELRWTSEPQLVLRRGDVREDLPLPSEARAWLSANEARFSPATARSRRIDLSSEAPIAQEPSRCGDTELCLAAAPLGATGKELVRYGEIDFTKRDDTAYGPLCTIFDPADGTWYADIDLQRRATNPREFSEDETACGVGMQVDITGRAFLWNDLLCVNWACRRAAGAIGFVRGNFFFAAGGQ